MCPMFLPYERERHYLGQGVQTDGLASLTFYGTDSREERSLRYTPHSTEIGILPCNLLNVIMKVPNSALVRHVFEILICQHQY
jgi:hypothetical protein